MATSPAAATVSITSRKASARTTIGVGPDRRTRQAKKADHTHSAVRGAASHQPEVCLVAARTATAVNKTAPPRRRAIAYQPASQFRAWSDGPADRRRRARRWRPAEGWICPPTEWPATSTGLVCGRDRAGQWLRALIGRKHTAKAGCWVLARHAVRPDDGERGVMDQKILRLGCSTGGSDHPHAGLPS